MPSFAKTPPEVRAAFEAALPVDARVQRRKMFGCDAAFANDQLFFGTFEDRLMLRLPEEARAEARDTIPGAGPFDPMGGRPMREYVELPGDTPLPTLVTWAVRSFSWVVTLPPKVKKPAKPKAPKANKLRPS